MILEPDFDLVTSRIATRQGLEGNRWDEAGIATATWSHRLLIGSGRDFRASLIQYNTGTSANE